MQGGTWEEPQVLDKRSRQLAQAACTTLMEAMLTRSPKKDVRIATVPMRTLMVEGPRTNNTLSKLAMTTTRRRLGAMTPTTIKAQIRQETIEMLSCKKKKIGASVLQKAKGKRKKKAMNGVSPDIKMEDGNKMGDPMELQGSVSQAACNCRGWSPNVQPQGQVARQVTRGHFEKSRV